MSLEPRRFVFMCLSQAACLALGLWIRGHLLSALLEEGDAAGSVSMRIAEVLLFLWTIGLQTAAAWVVLSAAASSVGDQLGTQASLPKLYEIVKCDQRSVPSIVPDWPTIAHRTTGGTSDESDVKSSDWEGNPAQLRTGL
ncbi:hypothetical protein [Planctomicrobium sp. SH664]|uniref:hypothetical protein n=1 Tax=Planctomicrobium sp. SH664 TaxID=3448125 RepID=UPI003F5C2C5C